MVKHCFTRVLTSWCAWSLCCSKHWWHAVHVYCASYVYDCLNCMFWKNGFSIYDHVSFDPGQPQPTPASRSLSRPWRPFMFFAFPSQFWPRPTAARPGRADPVAVASLFFFFPWPAWPKPGLWLGSPWLSGPALTPVYPGLAGFLMPEVFAVLNTGDMLCMSIALAMFMIV